MPYTPTYDPGPKPHDLNPVPLAAGPLDTQPIHVRMGMAQPGGESTIGHDGKTVPYKTGSKFVVHKNELLGPDGRILRVFPLYADNLKAGKIIGPYSGAEYEGHGGSGYGAMPIRYGKYAWASLHQNNEQYKDRDDTSVRGGPAGTLHKHISEEVARNGGALGVIVNGGQRGAAQGNSFIWKMLHDELQHLASTGARDEINRAIQGEAGLSEAGVTNIEGLAELAKSRYGASIRGEAMAPTMNKLATQDKNGKRGAGGNIFTDAVRAVFDAALDYKHVPGGHALSVVRFGHGYGAVHDPYDTGTYAHAHPGVYLGELQHSIPLQHLLPDAWTDIAGRHVFNKKQGIYVPKTLPQTGSAMLTRTMGNPNKSDRDTAARVLDMAKAVADETYDDPSQHQAEMIAEALQPHTQALLQEALLNAVHHGRPYLMRDRFSDPGGVSGALDKALGSGPRVLALVKGLTPAARKRHLAAAQEEIKKLNPGDSYCPECGAVFEWGGETCNRCGSGMTPVEIQGLGASKAIVRTLDPYGRGHSQYHVPPYDFNGYDEALENAARREFHANPYGEDNGFILRNGDLLATADTARGGQGDDYAAYAGGHGGISDALPHEIGGSPVQHAIPYFMHQTGALRFGKFRGMSNVSHIHPITPEQMATVSRLHERGTPFHIEAIHPHDLETTVHYDSGHPQLVSQLHGMMNRSSEAVRGMGFPGAMSIAPLHEGGS